MSQLMFIFFNRDINVPLKKRRDIATMATSSTLSDEARNDGKELQMPKPPEDWKLNCLLTDLDLKMTTDDFERAKTLFRGLYIIIKGEVGIVTSNFLTDRSKSVFSFSGL